MDSAVLWYASRATGVVSLILFTAVMVLGMATAGRAGGPGATLQRRGRRTGAALTRARIHRLHREMSVVALLFLVLHIVSAIIDGYVELNLLDVFVPFGAGYSPLWVGIGAVAVDLAVVIGVSSLIRTRIPLRLWRGIHLTAYAIWPLAVLHSLFTAGGDGSSLWLQLVVAVNLVAVLAAAARWRRRDRHPDVRARRAADHHHLAGSRG